MRLSRIFRVGLALALMVLAFDQYSKHLIVNTVMQPPRVIEVTTFFNLVMGWNTGVSFGLFASNSEVGRWVLPGIALLVVAGLLVWMARTDRMTAGVGLGAIVGGALGNVIDRVNHGAVADFLDFHVAGYHWPAFNVADMGISVGAGLLILDSLLDGGKSRKIDARKSKDDRP